MEIKLEQLTVHAYDFTIRDANTPEDHVEIQCWALDQKSNPYLLRFLNFPAFCHIELPKDYDWNSQNIDLFIKSLSLKLGIHAPYNHSFKYSKKLYYYQQGQLFPIITVSFSSLYNMRKCGYILKYPIKIDKIGYIQCNIWEDDISIVRKLLTIQNIKFSQWFTILGQKVNPHISSLNNEYIVDFTTMNPVDSNKNIITNPKILSLNIKNNNNEIIISAIYQKLQIPTSKQHYFIILDKQSYKEYSIKNIGNFQIYHISTDEQLTSLWNEIIQKIDPEIITGIDFDHQDDRIKSWLLNWPCRLTKDIITTRAWNIKNYNFPYMPGRIILEPEFKTSEIKFETSKYLSNDEELGKLLENLSINCEQTIQWVEKFHIWVGLIEMSNIVGVCISELSIRRQQIRCLSQLYDIAAKTGYIINKQYKSEIINTGGGKVYEPNPGLYDNVIILDFASLYPSIIIALNICWTTLIPPKITFPDGDCNTIVCSEEDAPQNRYIHKFYNKEEGLLPRLVRLLITERKNIKKQIATLTFENKILEKINFIHDRLQSKEKLEKFLIEDNIYEDNELLNEFRRIEKIISNNEELEGLRIELEKSKPERLSRIETNIISMIILNKRQIALKISAVSFYGFLGVHDGLLPLFEGAMAITTKGREWIVKVEEYIEEKYKGKLIYGDTDSVMFKLPFIVNSKQCHYWGIRLAEEINGLQPGDIDCDNIIWPNGRPGLFPPPLTIIFEKAMRLLTFCKKRYAGFLIDKDGNFEKESDGSYVIFKRGIVLVQEGTCDFLRETYTDILEIVLKRGNFIDGLSILIDAIKNLLKGAIAHNKLLLNREIGKNYKTNYFLKVFSDKLKKEGKNINPGDRFNFLVMINDNAKSLGERMILEEEYLNSPDEYNIDYSYYIEHILMNPINQLFEIGFLDEIKKLSHISYRPTNRHNAIFLNQPVLLLSKLLSYNQSLDDFKLSIIQSYNKIQIKQLNIIPSNPSSQIRLNITIQK